MYQSQNQKMYRPNYMTFTLQNCITLENKIPLTFVPKQYTTYYINSKRRFFLYFKFKDQMSQTVKIFERENVRFHQRKSIFPDRQEQQEIVFHCNYKYKKKDLRWTLSRDTRIRQPVNRFNQRKNQSVKQLINTDSKESCTEIQMEKQISSHKEVPNLKSQNQNKTSSLMQKEQTSTDYVADFGDIKIKNPEVMNLINNLDFIKALFKSQKRK